MVRVELAEPTGWQRWRDVRLRALLDAPDAFGSSYEREVAFEESDWLVRIGSGPSWIAVADGTDVGTISGGPAHDSVPWVYAMWVDPVARGRGVAEALLGVVIDWARASGATRLGLDVADRASRARRFYERVGFVTGGRTFAMPRDPSITLIEMFLDLTDPVTPAP